MLTNKTKQCAIHKQLTNQVVRLCEHAAHCASKVAEDEFFQTNPVTSCRLKIIQF